MGPFFCPDAQLWLEHSPHKMRQEGEQQEHKDSAHPDQEVHCHLGIVDFFLVHIPTLTRPAFDDIGFGL